MAILPIDDFCGFSHPLQENAEKSACNDRYLLQPVKSTIILFYIASYIDSVVIQILTTIDN
jgi:hypothetical protein